MTRLKSITQIFVLIFLLAGTSHATLLEDKCRHLKDLDPATLAAVKPEFLAAHDTHYTIEVEPPPVRAQCQYGGCYAYATLAEIEVDITKRTGKKIDLSEQYLIAQTLLEKIDRALEDPKKAKIIEGTHLHAAEWVIRHRGIVPAEAWSPRVPFENAPHSKRLLLFLNHRIAEYHLAKAALAATDAKQGPLLAAAKADLTNIFETYMGKLPATVTFEGKSYTPLEFSAAFVAPGQSQVVWVQPNRTALPGALVPKPPAPPPRKKGTPRLPPPPPPPSEKNVMPPRYIYEGWPAIEQRIIASLLAGKAVPMSIDFVRELSDAKSGIVSLSAFHLPEGFQPVDEAARTHFNLVEGAHAVDIIGVDLDGAGRVRKYKIRNSWGPTHGDGGIDHVYSDYFQAYASYFFFR